MAYPAVKAGARSARGETASVRLSELKVGATLRSPIFADREDANQLLLAAGTILTKSLLGRMRSRGIRSVRVDRGELDRILRDSDAAGRRDGRGTERGRRIAHRAAAETERTAGCRWVSSAESFLHKIKAHGASSYDQRTANRFAKTYMASVRRVELLFDGLSHGEIHNAVGLAAMSSESLMKIAEDLDLFVALGITPATDKYPCKHSLQTAMFAMSIGTVLGLKADELIELGIGCLVHDAGMLHVRPDLVRAKKSLNQVEFLEITKHPVLTFDCLRDVSDLPNGSRLVAYQMHERLDGSGYPRRRTANQIHHLAKIAAVADVFVALISPRPHRPGILPYHAMEQIIHGARRGLYDPSVVRALLYTASLFPIGSYVQLSDGRTGKVVRANREAYTMPVVEVWSPGSEDQAPEILDLRDTPEMKVVSPVLGSTAAPTVQKPNAETDLHIQWV